MLIYIKESSPNLCAALLTAQITAIEIFMSHTTHSHYGRDQYSTSLSYVIIDVSRSTCITYTSLTRDLSYLYFYRTSLSYVTIGNIRLSRISHAQCTHSRALHYNVLQLYTIKCLITSHNHLAYNVY